MTTAADWLIAARFLRAAFEPDDWIAVLMKAADTGRVTQRVAPVQAVLSPPWSGWLRMMNHRCNVYVSVNALTPGSRERTAGAVAAVRHLFLDIDHEAARILPAIERELPAPSFVVQTSPGRYQVLWRVRSCPVIEAERIQKHLARSLGTDTAATSAAQTLRLPGFLNRKYSPAAPVSVEYRAPSVLYEPKEFPHDRTPSVAMPPPLRIRTRGNARNGLAVERARRYVARIPGAIAGNSGDEWTLRVCCQVARGFDLDGDQALLALSDWNARCDPPWSEQELLARIQHARRYGREPIGGLRDTSP